MTKLIVTLALLSVVGLAVSFISGFSAAAASKTPSGAAEEIREVESRIDRMEAETMARMKNEPGQFQKIELLGKLLLFDRELSVNRNEACAFCHMPETGFTGPVSSLNATTVAYPGSVRTRFSSRKPQSHTYATFAPVLHYNNAQGDFVGGNFWDMRATGTRLNNPVPDQAQGPPLNPVEMGLIDSACLVYRASRRPYRPLAEEIWGAEAFAIRWPLNVDQVCAQPGPAAASDPFPVHLNAIDRGTANRTFDQFAEAVAAYEASSEVNPFSSKYDSVLAGKAKFAPEEKAGYDLFRSATTHCNECHRDGGPGEEPLFTDFTASNLGVPANSAMPYYSETKADRFGYVANSLGTAYIDKGVGGFLESPQNSRPDWAQQAGAFTGKFKTPTLRNVDKRPRPDFVKAYMHNGYLKSLKEVVHFYNTRDALPRCQANDPGEKGTCWPAPEFAATMNRRQLGNLHLTGQQEDQIVAFLKTLTDGFESH
jgi:cytochrome c peroxidase